MKMAQKHRGPKFPVTHISQDLDKGESTKGQRGWGEDVGEWFWWLRWPSFLSSALLWLQKYLFSIAILEVDASTIKPYFGHLH